ncbi:hypothetical protein KVR01_009524 [Diaporthe batatas]|uniref:uncharacterized protein n=1 Tax=Diaporthe batatas TaxID=748121 RepID=UPI001D04EFA8|nr:uncharacterized protein KVR01_009524 [Diaporthe batatas]KAG8161260.1 hypothetical protein KVR01_009524 [Diaporthe batatas]
MAFARSASGPAGLSINTGAANLFGSTSSQPPPAGSIPASAQPSTQTNSLFGGNTITSQPQAQTPSLFGGNLNQQQQQQQQQQQPPGGGGGGLFGASMAASSQPSLFGSNTATAATGGGGGGGGLFGGMATSQPQQTGGGLFGSTATSTAQPSQGGGGGLFNAAATQSTPAAGGGLFGNTQNAAASLFGGGAGNTNSGTSSLFGQKPAQPGGLFGGQAATQPAQATSGGLFGGGLNKPTNHPQQSNPTLGATMNPQVVPGVRIDLSNMKSTTRFNDLHEDIQKGIADIDRFIQSCMSQKDQLDAFMPAHGEQLSAIPGDVRFVGRKYAAVDLALGADLHAIKQMRDLVKSDAEEAKLSFSAVDNLMLPSQYHVNNAPGFFGSSNRGGSGGDGKGGDDDDKTASDLVGYFSKQVDEMDEQIKRFQKNVREIEMHLGGVQQSVMDQASRLQNGGGGLGAGSAEEKQMELYAVLRDFEESILQVASGKGAEWGTLSHV